MGAPSSTPVQDIAQSVVSQPTQTAAGTPITTGQTFLSNQNKTVNTPTVRQAILNKLTNQSAPLNNSQAFVPGSVVTNGVKTNVDGTPYNPGQLATPQGGK
jgi:hypothetical protein